MFDEANWILDFFLVKNCPVQVFMSLDSKTSLLVRD